MEGREFWGKLDPRFMGGEYLPDMELGEVEIANIALASVTGDVIQVRARQVGDSIAYLIVDEYEEHGAYPPTTPERSRQPLSFGELIGLIDASPSRFPEESGGGLVEAPLAANLEGHGDPEELRSFVQGSFQRRAAKLLSFAI